MLTAENQAWLDDFVMKSIRRPLVLHIGNIANNAYNNAKILNQAGLDCDVICYDYYHIMGAPEWEDADFAGAVLDDFHPHWAALNLGNFERPEWFAQGPLPLCIDYLRARRTGDPKSRQLWRRLQLANQCSEPLTLREKLNQSRMLLRRALTKRYTNMIRAQEKMAPGLRRMSARLFLRVAAGLSSLLRAIRKQRRTAAPRAHGHGNESRVGDSSNLTSNIERQKQILVERFAKEFPDRTDRLVPGDLEIYGYCADGWRSLLSLYDIIIAYSTDPIIPLLYEKPYFALEHGTLRSIPYDCDGQGRRTALAYRMAAHVFVTNFDCAKSASFLAPSRYTLINHPYDEDHGLSVEGASATRAELLQRLDCDFLFFHPTRQDWVLGTGYADKSNDIFIRAFAELRRRGHRVGLVACKWGSNVADTKALLDELGCSRHVEWVPPLAVVVFERMCQACDVVADQFKLGSFGGVVFKAMAVGTPILTYLNEELVGRQYPVLPPVMSCSTEGEIVERMSRALADPTQLKLAGRAARKWIQTYHGKAGTVNRQLDAFRQTVRPSPIATRNPHDEPAGL